VVDVDDDDLIVHHHMSSGEIYSVSLTGGGVIHHSKHQNSWLPPQSAW